MSKFEFKRGKGFKVDDTFFKDNFDITGIEDNIYNQMAKTMARNVDIDLAKTPLVDILTGYTRYKEAEYELQQKENIIKEVREYIKFLKEHYEELRTNPVEDSYFINDMLRQMFIQSIEHYLLGIENILDKGE